MLQAICREKNHNMHFNGLFPLENRDIYKMWKKYDTAGEAPDDNTMHAALLRLQTHTQKKFCFPRQQWLRERASILHYTYIACLVTFTTNYLIIKHYRTSSSSIGTTAHSGLWPLEQCPSIFSYLPPTLSIFSLPALEDLFQLPLSIFSWVFPFFSSLPVLERRFFFGHPILIHSV